MIFTEALSFALQALSLVVPIFVAGIVFIWILKKDYLKVLSKSIDHGTVLGGKRLLGDNKTWRGVLVYVVVSVVVCYGLAAMARIYPDNVHPIYLDHPLVVGLVFALSYVTGEFLNSFMKRRLGIAPGSHEGGVTQKIVDNADGMIVTALTLVILFKVAIASILIAVAVGLALHFTTDVVMKRIGLK